MRPKGATLCTSSNYAIIFHLSIAESRTCSLKNINRARSNYLLFQRSCTVAELLTIEMRDDDLVSVTHHCQVWVMGNHNNLPAPDGISQSRNEKISNCLIVEIFLRLV